MFGEIWEGVWPQRCRDGHRGGKGSRQDFGEFDQVAKRIAEEGEAAADCRR